MPNNLKDLTPSEILGSEFTDSTGDKTTPEPETTPKNKTAPVTPNSVNDKGTPRKRTRRFSLMETVPKQPFSIVSTFITEITHLLNESAARDVGDDSKTLIIENLNIIQGTLTPRG